MDVSFDDLDLTKRQSVFVKEYVATNNGTQAAITAGFSEKGAAVTASRLLKHPKIQEALKRIRASVVNKVNETQTIKANLSAATSTAEAIAITAENLMVQLAKMGLTKDLLAKFLKDEDGHLYYNFTGATEEEKLLINAQISEIQFSSETRTVEQEEGPPIIVKTVRSKVKWQDHKAIIELMGRYKEIMAWKDRNQNDNKIQVEVIHSVVGHRRDTPQLASPEKIARIIEGHTIAAESNA